MSEVASIPKQPRGICDGRLYEEEIAGFVNLKVSGGQYECDHFPISSGRWERFYLRLTTPHPLFGEQVRGGAMCCECYQKLRRLGLAEFKGTWETIDPLADS